MVFNIGRHTGNDLILKDQTAEEFHAAIKISDDLVVTITDLNSKYGTLVENTKITRAVLEGDMKVQIGFTLIDWKKAVEKMMLQIPAASKPEGRHNIHFDENDEIPELHLSEIDGLLGGSDFPIGPAANNPGYSNDASHDLAVLAVEMMLQSETELPQEVKTMSTESKLAETETPAVVPQKIVETDEVGLDAQPLVIVETRSLSKPLKKRKLSDTEFYLLLAGIIGLMLAGGWWFAALFA